LLIDFIIVTKTLKKENKIMLHRKCLIRQENTEPLILIIHAESEEKIKETVEQTFGPNSLLYSKPFEI
jgi:hypothetical protein